MVVSILMIFLLNCEIKTIINYIRNMSIPKWILLR